LAAGAAAGAVVFTLVFRSPEWLKKVRVGENSPSFCPGLDDLAAAGPVGFLHLFHQMRVDIGTFTN